MTKIGLISDVHSNIEALEAVLKELDSRGVDQILCLGDVVGYGASPLECIKTLQDRDILTVKGNHDDYVTDITGELGRHLRAEVRDAIAWTQNKLGFDGVGWLTKLPMTLDFEEFSIIHASYSPLRWAYCLDEATFNVNFQYQKPQLAFCGHSHAPLIGLEMPAGQQPFVDYIHGQKIPEDCKVMVNVGSVGQPRDENPRAACVIYEMESRTLELVRVEYDVAAAQQKILKAGLPERFAMRLAIGK